MLDEVDGKMKKVRQIQTVQPDHGTGSVFAMVMPVPRRREDDIALLHLDALAVDGGESALAFDDEAHGERDVAMGGCGFVGHDKLEAGV